MCVCVCVCVCVRFYDQKEGPDSEKKCERDFEAALALEKRDTQVRRGVCVCVCAFMIEKRALTVRSASVTLRLPWHWRSVTHRCGVVCVCAIMIKKRALTVRRSASVTWKLP